MIISIELEPNIKPELRNEIIRDCKVFMYKHKYMIGVYSITGIFMYIKDIDKKYPVEYRLLNSLLQNGISYIKI